MRDCRVYLVARQLSNSAQQRFHPCTSTSESYALLYKLLVILALLLILTQQIAVQALLRKVRWGDY
ncbi:uncharacterized protein PHACADRAFT_257617 [Phanerochaete carnosa HHB-10118-sp]|uniref:Uncharacterized protein n=1 Tax=Phanerochaete carnosa (strain HHB-10118-sp) TaxID=650164 RepID=K5UVI1_PHACS|nr:uncharacterized protein PHACADRAFT_257617 [Phanerochaete carnosa HHB-10118-sp]EKM54031.1 hypothetical protein PHACADRAFT_257617 [Phanerochaete carnosa HHB-10118-sp]